MSGSWCLVCAVLASAAKIGEATELTALRDARTCSGFERSFAQCEGLPPCGKPCEPADCEFASWGDWHAAGDCTGLCHRHRGIAVANNECGQPCAGSKSESKACPQEQCLTKSKDCALSEWSDWSACSTSVDQKYRYRELARRAEGNGEPCLGNLNETLPCDAALPVDCELSEWGEWTPCSATCDGYEAALRRVLHHAKHGGKPCEGTTRKTRTCNAGEVAGTCGREVRNCQLGHWSDWQGCDFASPAQRYRMRDVETSARDGGKACGGALREAAVCPAEAPKDCAFSAWSSWSQCDRTCGGGQSYRERKLLAPAKRNGSCAALSKVRELAPCNVEACTSAQACSLSGWSEWSACSATCDIGQRERSREMTFGKAARRLSWLDSIADVAAKVSQAPPPLDCSAGFSGGLKEVAPCEAQACQFQDCAWGDWAEWSACTCTCGSGSKVRNRAVKIPPGAGGKRCEPQDKSEVAVCNTQSCEQCIDGVWGDWSAWSLCSATCGSGFRNRKRDVAQFPNQCGKAVSGIEDDFAACEAQVPCVADVDCTLSDWTAWSDCSGACFGVAERLREVVALPSGMGAPCSQARLKEVAACNPRIGEAPPSECEGPARPPLPCQLAAWGDWGACSADCGAGQQHRLRHVLNPAAAGGSLCAGSLGETRECNGMACERPGCVDCAYGDWGSWGECSKCGGQRYRHRSVAQLPNACGKRCELEDAKQTGICTSECDEERWCSWAQWSEYGPCSAECGPATRTRQRNLAISEHKPHEPLFSGAQGLTCEAVQLESTTCEFRSCSEDCKPTDCAMGEWSDWSDPSCAQLCERRRAVVSANSCGGQACSGALVETRPCARDCHPEASCVFSAWGGWSVCDSPAGQSFRSRTILNEARNGGLPCRGGLSETRFCSTPQPTQHCELSGWSVWSPCTQSCLGGMRQRTRSVARTSVSGGAPCAGSLDELAVCNTGPCEEESKKPCVLGDWEDWSGCGRSAQRERTRAIKEGGGQPCQASLHELQPCRQSVDCVASDWSSWGECDKACDGGQQLRHRQVVQNQLLGGKPCPPDLMETRGCNRSPCNNKVDCQVDSWAQWSACSVSCGRGQRQRARMIIKQPLGGGEGCGLELSQLEACAEQPCDYADCLWSNWQDWSDCSAHCNGGQRTRERHVLRSPGRGGKPCAALSKEEVAVCNTHPCNSEQCIEGAWSEWQDWERCSSSCRGGLTWRSRSVAVEANHCGRPATGPSRENGRCNDDVPCELDVDCAIGDWGAWSDCTATCEGVKRRSRVVAVHGRGGGEFCAGPLKETAPCNTLALKCIAPPVDCELSEWASWSTCSASCDGGSQQRERRVLVEPASGGRACNSTVGEVRGCGHKPCVQACKPKDCVWADWDDWSACDKCGGERKRFRHVLAEAACGGAACEARASEEASRCSRMCHEPVYCGWGDWKDWGACSATCGEGAQKSRERHLVLSPDAPARFLEESAKLGEPLVGLHQEARELREGNLRALVVAFLGGGMAFVVVLAVQRRCSRGYEG